MQFRRYKFGLPAVALAAALLCACAPAMAQGHEPPGHGHEGGFGFGSGLTRVPAGDTRVPAPPTESSGLQLGPPGRWWDDKNFARSIGLNSFQQHRMDDVFGANKDNLMKYQKSLQFEQGQLRKLTRNGTLDENRINQQIDRVTTARGELEKAYAHMLLMIRKEMTPEQTAKLDEQSVAQ